MHAIQAGRDVSRMNAKGRRDGKPCVLIAHPQRLLVEALSLALARDDLEIAGVSGEDREVLAAVQRWSPDLVLLGPNVPDAGSIEVGRRILQSRPRSTVLILVDPAKPSALSDVQSSRLGCVPLNIAAAEVIGIVDAALEGRVVDSHPRSAAVGTGTPREHVDDSWLGEWLTSREREVLTLLVEGASNKRIAEILRVSPYTATTHVKNIFSKLQVHSRVEALLFATSSGVVNVPTRNLGQPRYAHECL